MKELIAELKARKSCQSPISLTLLDIDILLEGIERLEKDIERLEVELRISKKIKLPIVISATKIKSFLNLS